MVRTMNPLLDLMKSHVSVRSYKDKEVPDELLAEIVAAAQASSTSSHIQAYSVVRVFDPDKRARISEVAGGQKWVVDAPVFMVHCADLVRLGAASEIEGQGALEGWFEHSLAAIVDVALFAQSVMLAAEASGLGGVFIGGIRNDPDAVIEQLALPRQVYPVFGMCLGWPKGKVGAKPRLPKVEVMHADTYDAEKLGGNLGEYNQVMAGYYEDRGAGTSRNWNRTVADALQKKKREHMKASFERAGFFLK